MLNPTQIHRASKLVFPAVVLRCPDLVHSLHHAYDVNIPSSVLPKSNMTTVTEVQSASARLFAGTWRP